MVNPDYLAFGDLLTAFFFMPDGCATFFLIRCQVCMQLPHEAMESLAKFAWRPNLEGGTDSICLKCYRTVATTFYESDRQTKEAGHVCEQMDLAVLVPEQPDTKGQHTTAAGQGWMSCETVVHDLG
jgi:hypothetical protein